MPAEIAAKSTRRTRRPRSRRTPWYRAWYQNVAPIRLVVGGVSIVLLCGLAVHAASLGLAYLQVVRVENHLQRWSETGEEPSAGKLAGALSAIDRAIELHADNPYQLTLKARLLQWRAYSFGAEGGAEHDYRAALALHRRAAALRPLWPESWAEMAAVKLQLNELDDELDRFLIQADKLGPYTPAVHSAVVRTGFARLALNPFQKVPLLQKHLLRGLQDHRTRDEIRQLVQYYRQEIMTCRLLAQAPEPKPQVKFCSTGLSATTG